MAFCRNCGNELRAEWKLCPHCGTSAEHATRGEAEPTTTVPRIRPLALVTMALVVVVVLAIALRPHSSPDQRWCDAAGEAMDTITGTKEGPREVARALRESLRDLDARYDEMNESFQVESGAAQFASIVRRLATEMDTREEMTSASPAMQEMIEFMAQVQRNVNFPNCEDLRD